MGFNYKYYRSRYKPKVVSELPKDMRYITVKEAADYYGVTSQTIRHWYLSGKLISVMYNRKIFVRVSGSINDMLGFVSKKDIRPGVI